MKPGMRVVFKDFGLCPCGQPIGASLELETVAHREPQCAPFRLFTPADFLAYVRASRGCFCEADEHDASCPLHPIKSRE